MVGRGGEGGGGGGVRETGTSEPLGVKTVPLDPKQMRVVAQMVVNRGSRSNRKSTPKEARYRWLVRGVRVTPAGLVADCEENPKWVPPVVRPKVSEEEWQRCFRASVREELSLFPDGMTKNNLHRRVGGQRSTFYRELGRLIGEGLVGVKFGPRRAHVVYLISGGE